jgi:hypothetical protein
LTVARMRLGIRFRRHRPNLPTLLYLQELSIAAIRPGLIACLGWLLSPHLF